MSVFTKVHVKKNTITIQSIHEDICCVYIYFILAGIAAETNIHILLIAQTVSSRFLFHFIKLKESAYWEPVFFLRIWGLRLWETNDNYMLLLLMQIDLDENTGQTESLKRVNYDFTNHPKMSIFSFKKKKKCQCQNVSKIQTIDF